MRKNNTITIRKATKKDIPKIAKIHKDCVLLTNSKFYPPSIIKEWVHQISSVNILEQFKNTSWFVIELNKKIIGFCQIFLERKELYQINIVPKLQKKGFGKILYNFAEKEFKKKGCDKIYLNATLNSEKFYESLGFKKTKKIKFKINNDSLDMIKMVKNITSQFFYPLKSSRNTLLSP